MEVGPLSREVILLLAQPLSSSLQTGFRFLHPPLPAVPSIDLAVDLPRRESDGLTTFRASSKDDLDLSFTPVAQHLRQSRA